MTASKITWTGTIGRKPSGPALLRAIAHKNVEAMRWCLDQDVDPNGRWLRTIYGGRAPDRAPLRDAVRAGWAEGVRTLIDAEAFTGVSSEQQSGHWVLELAASAGKVQPLLGVLKEQRIKLHHRRGEAAWAVRAFWEMTKEKDWAAFASVDPRGPGRWWLDVLLAHAEIQPEPHYEKALRWFLGGDVVPSAKQIRWAEEIAWPDAALMMQARADKASLESVVVAGSAISAPSPTHRRM